MAQGLTSNEAESKLKQYGLNRLKKPYEVKFFAIVKEEVTEPMILLLLVVGVIYSFWGKLEDAITIFAVIFLLVLVEILNEYRAKKAIASLSVLSAPDSKVYRNGKLEDIKTEEIVPEDLILLSAGTIVPADAKIISSFSLQADESSLTGESVPVSKSKDDIVYAGTLITEGEAKAIVISTGFSTKLGVISSKASVIKPPKSPLQLSMKSLAKNLVWVALFFSIMIPMLGVLRGNDIKEMILTGLALAFAVIPEELPIIITMILGLGAYKLSNQSFLVKKVKAAEVLGDATVILTDKTGTITENKMNVVALYPKKDEKIIIQTAYEALTESSLSPTDNAIRKKFDELKLKASIAEISRERVFDKSRKTKSIIRGNEVIMVGAPEEVLKFCSKHEKEVFNQIKEQAMKGRRIIGVASKKLSVSMKNLGFEKLEKNMKFIGLIIIEDPPRKGVKDTIEIAKKAGVRTIMVTGDYPLTAEYIANEVGIDSKRVLTGEDIDKMSEDELKKAVSEVSVFARTTPEHKYLLVKALQLNHEIVAVTGDGINDSLALKGADIGIAMGIKGTDAAKEAAEVVLADDNYITISKALFEGRKFYDNLKKGVKYYLSVKVALILVFLTPILFGLALPFAPIQIIILELFMDLAASAGFVSEPAEKSIYTKNPEKKKSFFDPSMIKGIITSSLSLFAIVMLAYLYALNSGFSAALSQSFAFNAWIMGHILLAFVSRSDKEPLTKLGFFTNKIMNLWAIGVIVFIFMINFLPVISTQLKLVQLNFSQLGLILLESVIILSAKEVAKYLNKNPV
jgi:Ca2+-transporting ATPase